MALLARQQIQVTGNDLTFAAASGGGDTIPNGDNLALLVQNGDGTSTDVTIVVPGNDKYGNARPDIVHTVAAGAVAALGPLPRDLVDLADDGLIDVTYSKVTSLGVALVAL